MTATEAIHMLNHLKSDDYVKGISRQAERPPFIDVANNIGGRINIDADVVINAESDEFRLQSTGTRSDF